MHKKRLLVTVVAVLAFVSLNTALVFLTAAQDTTPTPLPPAHWEYTGEEGPDHWGELDPNYAACRTGLAQSPIDISGALAGDLTPIAFSYQASALNIFNNGHTIQVNYDAGSSILYNEDTYQLLQFHFHHPSEHTINGQSFPMELHLVHKDASGNLAVVGVMLAEGAADNPAFSVVFDNLPTEKGDPQPTELTIDAASLLPAETLYDTYSGSLTTPPCTQGVRWLVLQTPVEVSAAQLDAFGAIFAMNARPVQPLNTRDLLEDNAADS